MRRVDRLYERIEHGIRTFGLGFGFVGKELAMITVYTYRGKDLPLTAAQHQPYDLVTGLRTQHVQRMAGATAYLMFDYALERYDVKRPHGWWYGPDDALVRWLSPQLDPLNLRLGHRVFAVTCDKRQRSMVQRNDIWTIAPGSVWTLFKK